MDKYLEEQADILLHEIKEITDWISERERDAEVEVAAIRQKYETELGALKDHLVDLDKEIVFLMKDSKGPLFDGRDKINLANGILLYAKERKITLPRDVIARIEEHGFAEAIKIAKSVDRAVIEQWPEERLFMVGGRKKLVEKFGYEVMKTEDGGRV
ncbi:MAG: host-nuclease inhibitor Gam family protein [Desulfobacterales bacterium]|nr:host-nuclease inhibitor Gam family protein [Desulfobacterales bacterium]